MAGVSVDGGGGGKRALNSEVNMVPMIDLLMCTISFLLITAVWSQLARINANAQVPSQRPDTEIEKTEPEKMLHITMKAGDTPGKTKFELVWRQGAQPGVSEPMETSGVRRKDGLHFPELAKKIEELWKKEGNHRDRSDKKVDQVVLHTENDVPYGDLVGVIDAIYETERDLDPSSGKTVKIPVFNVTFAVN